MIPDQFDDLPLPVRRIGDGAFKDNEIVMSVVIPMGVTAIGNSAFLECSSMASMEIPDGVTSIGSEAFRNCTSLTSITIPNSLTNIEYDAFSGCQPAVINAYEQWVFRQKGIADKERKKINHQSFDGSRNFWTRTIEFWVLLSLEVRINDKALIFIEKQVYKIG